MLKERLQDCGLTITDGQEAQLLRYHALLMDWNTRMDLTAVTDEAEMIDRHYVDSLLPLTLPGLFPKSARLIDVGSGAGFPGLPLAIVRPDFQVTLLDAQQKRCLFLQAVADDLALTNVTVLHSRAEDAARDPQLRERFDIAIARAVAALPVLLEYLLPFVGIGGAALCMKGPGVADELAQGRKAALLLGGALEAPLPCPLPGRDWQHLLVAARKKQKTARQYPRKAGTPTRSPLGGCDKPPASATKSK